jgi:hypothetical protein
MKPVARGYNICTTFNNTLYMWHHDILSLLSLFEMNSGKLRLIFNISFRLPPVTPLFTTTSASFNHFETLSSANL